MHNILEKAVRQLKITSPGTGTTLSVQEYRNALLEHRNTLPENREGDPCGGYMIQIMDEKTRSDLDALLRESFSKYKTSDDYILYGIVFGGRRVEGNKYDEFIEHYTRSLIDSSIKDGSHIASKAFYACTRNERIYFDNVVAFDRVTIDENHRIFDGIEFINYQDEYSPGMNFPSVGIGDIRIRPRTAIINRGYMSSFSLGEDDLQSPEQHESFVTENFNPFVFCNILSLVCRQVIFPRYQWRVLDPSQIVQPSGRGMEIYEDSHITCNISISELEKAKELFIILQENDSLNSLLEIPISRLMASRKIFGTLGDRFIDLAIALESLYIPNKNHGASYQLSQCAAWHMGGTFKERKKIHDDVQKTYRLRSKAVHGGTLGIDKIKHEAYRDIRSTFERSQEICSKAIIKIIEEGYPNFDHLVLGEGL